MKEARFFYVPDADTATELPAAEAMHALRVLRLRSGDELFLMDGKGNFHRAVVTTAATRHCMYEIKETMPQTKAWKGNIHLAVAPTKNTERIEWLAEKATEIGIDELTMLNCSLSERKIMRTARVEKIVVAAMKQSRKPWKPTVNDMTDFKAFIAKERGGLKFIAHCHEDIERSDLFNYLREHRDGNDRADVTVMIGPEGDFSTDEVRLAKAKGFVSVSLSDSRLRTETAALYATATAHLADKERRRG